MNPRPKSRFMTVPNWPDAHTLDIARRIRMDFGYGGANFPGARDLYEAARKIEAWAAEWDWDDTEAEGSPCAQNVPTEPS